MQRRDFVSALAGTAALPALSRLERASAGTAPAGAPAAAPAATVPATNIEVRRDYPPMPPLDRAVFERRLDRARQLTADAGCSALVATSGDTNFRYLVGDDFGRSERLIALILPVRGEPVIVTPSFEAERVRRGAIVGKVRGWEEHEDPFALSRDVLRESGATSRLLVEPNTLYWMAMRFASAVPGMALHDGTAAFETLRLVKSREEIARMRRAVEITEDVIATTFDQLRPGMRDSEIAAMIAAEHRARGVSGGALVQLGPQSALPHGGTIDSVLQENMVVLVDGGCSFQGYASDITRTRWFGERPPAKLKQVYDLVHDAQSAAIERVKPGVACQEIDRAARRVIDAAGYGKFFTHRVGHGMGMDGHEAAYMVEGNTRALEPGFVFSVEPGIYMLGEFGVRLEDDVTCTPSGAEILSRRAPRMA